MTGAGRALQIGAATPADEPAIRSLLERSGLPVSDLGPGSFATFLALRDGDVLRGTVGLDLAGNFALLRSLAVDDALRGRGCGSDLVTAVERLAQSRGVREIYLLTTSADTFFAARGYRVAPRDQAPPAIASMPQFRGLCPASSVFMVRPL